MTMSRSAKNAIFQFDTILGPHGKNLQSSVAKKCRQHLESHPEDSTTWMRLGHSLRALAKYQESADAYHQAARYDASPYSAENLCNLLNGKYEPKEQSQEDIFLPAPFILKDSFLNPSEQQKIWRLYAENKENYHQSRIGGKTSLDLQYRASMVISRSKLGSAELDFFEQKLCPYLIQAYDYFGIQHPDQQRISMQMTSHSDGEYYRIHRDVGEAMPKRLMTFVYYFCQQPKSFSGGDLQLFDTNEWQGTFSNHYTTIEPLDNRLVLFPSQFFHQVSKVNMSVDDRHYGRHTINGWHSDLNQE